MQKLVSIISPCYNGECYLSRFLESVLKQDYDNIELILVDDGSTDNTRSIIFNYKEKFEKRGYKCKYIYQENNGQAAAINKGLDVFAGEYMMWVDSDDILMEQNVSEKVLFLEKNLQCGFVLCMGEIVSHDNIDTPIGYLRRIAPSNFEEDCLFEDLIYGKNVVYGPGTIMVRKDVLLDSIPKRRIHESREGQNWQLILPIAYNYKCGYINKVLMKCVSHSDSHSRRKRTYEEEIAREDNFEEMLIYTIKNIPHMSEEEVNKWIRRINIKTTKTKMHLAYSQNKWIFGKKMYERLKNLNDTVSIKDKYLYYKLQQYYKKILNVCRKLRECSNNKEFTEIK